MFSVEIDAGLIAVIVGVLLTGIMTWAAFVTVTLFRTILVVKRLESRLFDINHLGNSALPDELP